MKDVTKSNEDYLETILMLEKEGAAKSVEVAAALSVTKAAVSIAMNNLISKGLINKEAYGDIRLTSEGRQIAAATLGKHELIKKVLIDIGVDADTAEIECCKIEHILSDETVKCLTEVCKRNKF